MKSNATGASLRANTGILPQKSAGSRGGQNRGKQHLNETAPDANLNDRTMLSPQQMPMPNTT